VNRRLDHNGWLKDFFACWQRRQQFKIESRSAGNVHQITEGRRAFTDGKNNGRARATHRQTCATQPTGQRDKTANDSTREIPAGKIGKFSIGDLFRPPRLS
jgi:hypothetical protein